MMPIGAVYSSRGANETVYEFLERRERELLNIQAALRTELATAENELSHVQSAKRQIGNLGGADKDRFGAPGLQASPNALSHLVGPKGTLPVDPNPVFESPAPRFSEDLGSALVALGGSISDAEKRPTIKDLIMMAMFSGYQDRGATQVDLRRFIIDAYGRNIAPTSMSPQISRLKEEGFLIQKGADNYRLTNEGLYYAARTMRANTFGLPVEMPKK
jgi:hypothetical protein